MSEIEQAFRKIYADVGAGAEVSPRGQKVIEVENYSYELPPYARFANFEARKLKLGYVKKELLWYLKADPFDLSIVDAASLWQELPNADGTINSHYGAHVFGRSEDQWRAPLSIGVPLAPRSQFSAIINELKRDKDSRRASAVILNRSHLLNPATKDFPCTYALNFRIRNDELKMSVHMRSQDAVFGMGNDAPAFSVIQEMIYVCLRDFAYPDLKLGAYHHIADSFHYYERHFDMVQEINAGSPFTEIDVPRIRDSSEVLSLLGLGGKDSKPGDFTAWLNS